MVFKIRKRIISVDKKISYFSFIFILYSGLPVKHHINVKYLKVDARKDTLQMSDMFKVMSVSGLYQS